MALYFIKVVVSALLIVTISELGKRNAILAALFASIPVVSVLAILWLYYDTKDTLVIAKLSTDIFWLVLPSLLFFLILPLLLRLKVHFIPAISLSLAIMVLGYFIMTLILKKFSLI